MILGFLNWLENLYTGHIQDYGDEYYQKNHLRIQRSPLNFAVRRYMRYVARTCMLGESVKPRGWKVLDVGCGVGTLVGEMARMGHEAVGIDVNEAAIRNSVARAHCHLVADSGKLDYPDGYFDLVVSREVLEHIDASQIDRCIDEWDRVGRGRMVHIIAVTERGQSAYDDPTHVNVRPESWWEATFRGHGYVRKHAPGVFYSLYGTTGYFVLDKEPAASRVVAAQPPSTRARASASV